MTQAEKDAAWLKLEPMIRAVERNITDCGAVITQAFEIIRTLDVPDLLCGRNLQGVNLSGATGEYERLFDGISFRGCNLSGATFERSNLRGVDFTGANLFEARLNHATIEGATFRGSDLRNADLTGLYGARADFMGARLGGARILSWLSGYPKLFDLADVPDGVDWGQNCAHKGWCPDCDAPAGLPCLSTALTVPRVLRRTHNRRPEMEPYA